MIIESILCPHDLLETTQYVGTVFYILSVSLEEEMILIIMPENKPTLFYKTYIIMQAQLGFWCTPTFFKALNL